jgi:hypothetical protein
LKNTTLAKAQKSFQQAEAWADNALLFIAHMQREHLAFV